jgi:hypothetical protein
MSKEENQYRLNQYINDIIRLIDIDNSECNSYYIIQFITELYNIKVEYVHSIIDFLIGDALTIGHILHIANDILLDKKNVKILLFGNYDKVLYPKDVLKAFDKNKAKGNVFYVENTTGASDILDYLKEKYSKSGKSLRILNSILRHINKSENMKTVFNRFFEILTPYKEIERLSKHLALYNESLDKYYEISFFIKNVFEIDIEPYYDNTKFTFYLSHKLREYNLSLYNVKNKI